MQAKKYNDIKRYLTVSSLPSDFSSTISNFRRESANYQVNANGLLTRGGLIVAKYADRKQIFDALHASHSVTSLNCA